MNDNLSYSPITASDARANLYALIKSASTGAKTHEIHLRGHKPVVLIGKHELESWLETLDVMANPEEVDAIAAAKQTTKTYSHKEFLKVIGIENDTDL